MIPGIVAGQVLPTDGGGGLPTTIGEAFGGGYYIGDITVGADTYAIIMAGPPGVAESLMWKTSRTATTGTGSLVDGFANTAAMVLAGDHPAADYCDGYAGGGYGDWYMPAKDELNLAWTNRSSLGSLSMGSATYWSSTESSLSRAWAQYFASGAQLNYYKNQTYSVRPVRRLLK